MPAWLSASRNLCLNHLCYQHLSRWEMTDWLPLDSHLCQSGLMGLSWAWAAVVYFAEWNVNSLRVSFCLIEVVKKGQQHDSLLTSLNKCLGMPRNWGASILEHWNISETAALEILRRNWAMGFNHRCMTLAITELIEGTMYCGKSGKPHVWMLKPWFPASVPLNQPCEVCECNMYNKNISIAVYNSI